MLKQRIKPFYISVLYMALTFFINSAVAQQSFFKTFNSEYTIDVNQIIQADDDSFLLLQNEEDRQKNIYYGNILQFNASGNLINLKSFNGPDGGKTHCISSYKPDQYLLCGSKDSLTLKGRFQTRYISIINNNLQEIYTYNFPPQRDTSSALKQIKVISDSVVLVLENYKNIIPPVRPKFRIWKINLYKGITKVYDPNLFSFSAFDLLFDQRTNQIIISYMGDFINDEREALAKLLILDSCLNYIDCIAAPDFMLSYTYFNKFKEDSYLISSLGHIFSKNLYEAIYLYEMSYLHDSLNATYIYPDHPIDTIVYPFFLNPLTANENKIAVGVNYNIQPAVGLWQKMPAWVQLNFLDPELNLTKQVYYGDGQKIYFGMDIQPTSDDGYIICGITKEIQSLKFDYFLLKVNSEGLITGMDEPQGISASEALVYPNPGGQQFKVKLAMQHQNALLEMFSINGKLVLRKEINQQQTEINTQTLPQGCYTYRITAEGKKIADGKWVKE